MICLNLSIISKSLWKILYDACVLFQLVILVFLSFSGLEAKEIKILTVPNLFILMSKLQVAPSREPLIRGVS